MFECAPLWYEIVCQWSETNMERVYSFLYKYGLKCQDEVKSTKLEKQRCEWKEGWKMSSVCVRPDVTERTSVGVEIGNHCSCFLCST